MRTCVVCREKRPKRELLRVVRTPGGEVMVDAGGRLDGRGGYVCVARESGEPGKSGEAEDGQGHWGDRHIRAKLGHALSVELAQDDIDRLREAAETA